MISSSHNFLFIHIPKTAGNAIQSVLKDYSDEYIACVAPHHDGVERFEVRSKDYEIKKHSTLQDYQEQLGTGVINERFKISCCRNPWERMISFYFSPHRGLTRWNRSDFYQFVYNVEPMRYYLEYKDSNEKTGSCFDNVDFYIHYESLTQDFETLRKKLGISHQPLIRRNASNRDHYKQYYDDELVEIVRDRFSDEIERFSYMF